MSDPSAATGERKPATCHQCTAVVEQERHIHLSGAESHHLVKHDAPCGLPCFGAGVPVRAYRSGEYHRASGCPRCTGSQP